MERMGTYDSSCLYESDEMSLRYSDGTLDVIWEGYCHNSMDHLVEEAKAGIRPSLLKGSPTELVRHSCYAWPVIIITGRPACGPSSWSVFFP